MMTQQPPQAEGDEGSALGRRARRLALLWAGLIAAAWIFPASPVQGMVLCPFRALTGHSCPGCGMTRACVAAVRGDVWGSLSAHPLGVVLLVGLGVATVVAAWEWRQGRRIAWSEPTQRAGRAAMIGAVIFVVLFGATRLVAELLGFVSAT